MSKPLNGAALQRHNLIFGAPALLPTLLLLLFNLCFRLATFSLRLLGSIQFSARANRRRNFALAVADVLKLTSFHVDYYLPRAWLRIANLGA